MLRSGHAIWERAARRHATGTTLAISGVIAISLSALPVPAWLRPFGSFDPERPVQGFAAKLLERRSPPSGWDEESAVPARVGDEEAVEQVEDDTSLPPPALAVGRRWQPPRREQYERHLALLGIAPVPLRSGCVEGTEESCRRRALDRFFGRLAAAPAAPGGPAVRVVHYGDSLVASDHITDIVRLRLQQRFGSGGRGFLFVDRLSRVVGRRARTGRATPGWRVDAIHQRSPVDRALGYAGVSFTALDGGEETVFDLGANRSAEVFYLSHPDGGILEILADERPIATVETKSDSRATGVERHVLPIGAKSLKLRAKTRGVRLFGASLETGGNGVVYEPFGLPGATSATWLVPDEDTFNGQLSARRPALFVTMLGGNDGLMLSRRRATREQLEADQRRLLDRLRKAAPEADCLVVSPMDAARAKVGGEIESKAEVPIIVEMQARVAADVGCAFWDMWRSMGGSGSLERWWKAGLINPDMVHPKGYGGDLLGEMMAAALMEAFDAWAEALR